MSKFCVKKPYTVLVGVVMVLVLGFISFTRITTDLLPTITLPYVMAITTYPGATPEKVESAVTQPLESSLGTVNGVKNVTSTSAENYSLVILEFEEDTNMDGAMVKLSTAVEQLRGVLPEEAGTPMLMELSPDMLPTMTVSLDYDGKDVKELSKFAEDTLIPYLERQDGVASVNSTGLTEEKVEIRLNQAKIDNVNDRLLAKIDSKFAEAKEKLDKTESELAASKGEIASGKNELASQQDSTYDELARYSQLMDEAMATSASYQAQVNGLKTSQAALSAEKDAYNEQIVPAYDQINEVLSQIGPMMGVQNLSVSTILADETQAMFRQVKLMIENMAQMQPDNQELASLSENFTWENLSMMEEKVTVRLPQIDTELANLETEIAAAQMVLEQVNTQVEEAKNNYASVEKGKLSAAAAFGAASAQLSAGESQLTSAQAQLDEAKEQYQSARETALKSANIDALVSMDTLSNLIYAQNFEMPAGYIKDGDKQFLLKIGDNFDSLEELQNTLLCNLDGIGDVRLSDVADVTLIDNSGESYARINGNDAVMLSIMKSSTAGTSDVSDKLNRAIEELEEKYEGLHITSLMDQGDYIKLIIQSVLKNLVYGAILAILILALFLKDVKPTIVVAFSIPLSVLFAIVLMYFSNVTLNIISLSGLALGVGMLVDNSIVVIENIYRLRSMGVPAPKAAVQGAKQVAGAIFASTLTTICVFLPIVFTKGMTRELFADMGLTIAYSLIASLIVALTFVPAMSSTVLKKSTEKTHPFFDKVLALYDKSLRICLQKKWIPLGLAIALLVGAVYGTTRMGLELIPNMSSNSISVSLTMNENLDQDTIYREVDNFTEEIADIEGVETVGAMSGGMTMNVMSISGMSTGEKQTQFTFYALLDEEHESDGDVIGKKIAKLGEGQEDTCEIEVSSSGMDMSALGGSGMEIDIQGQDLDTLLAISEDVKAILEQVEGFEEITNGQEEQDSGIKLALDKDAAMRNGLTVAQIYSELATALTTEKTATSLTLDGNEYSVIIVDESDTLTTENLMDYTFETTTKDEEGNDVTEEHKLSEFATKEDANSISSIYRENQARQISVNAVTKEGYNTSLLGRKVQKLLDEYDVPEGYTVEMAGEVVSVQDTMSDLIQMIALAVAFIYLIMVAQFQSLLSPFIVIFTIPLAFTGGLLALWGTGQTLSMVAMIGFLVLAGVVVNNGIVFVDYVNQLRLSGMEKREALVKTGKTRMRPILMTALTTILAMSTMALSQDMASAIGRGMATVTIGGLAYATLMTLFIVPVMYDIFFRRELKVIDVDTDVETESKMM
ncbi:MAG: efflux RND transporter permease subunit [Bariatricus sp.]|nr:efflux RND transporter permease subunit [Bariatricus sp.]